MKALSTSSNGAGPSFMREFYIEVSDSEVTLSLLVVVYCTYWNLYPQVSWHSTVQVPPKGKHFIDKQPDRKGLLEKETREKEEKSRRGNMGGGTRRERNLEWTLQKLLGLIKIFWSSSISCYILTTSTKIRSWESYNKGISHTLIGA